jgi:CBS-domain-containing membrane protein
MGQQAGRGRWRGVGDFIGIEIVPRSPLDLLLSGFGGLVGFVCISLTSSWLLGPTAALPIVASMGASAALVFAAPHGQFSQPWPVLVGHTISALVGVTAAKLVAVPLYAGALAVSGATVLMLLARALHPPGGATALFPVIAGPAVHALGYQYVLTPVMLNAATLLVIGVLFNLPFAWRRYPAGWHPRSEPPRAVPDELSELDFVAAVRELDTFIDIRDEDLLHIYEIATRGRREQSR